MPNHLFYLSTRYSKPVIEVYKRLKDGCLWYSGYFVNLDDAIKFRKSYGQNVGKSVPNLWWDVSKQVNKKEILNILKFIKFKWA